MFEIIILNHRFKKQNEHPQWFLFIYVNCEFRLFLFHWVGTPTAVQSMDSYELNTNSQTYSRNCVQSNFYYKTIEVNVVETGYYTFGSYSRIRLLSYIYKDNFNPFNPLENLHSQPDNNCNRGLDFKLIADLQISSTYILVVTTYSPNVTGNFSIFVSGPNNVSLNPIGEYLY